MNLHRVKLSHRFVLLISIFVLGFTVYGAWLLRTLNALKVNGPLYQSIVQNKDLVEEAAAQSLEDQAATLARAVSIFQLAPVPGAGRGGARLLVA